MTFNKQSNHPTIRDSSSSLSSTIQLLAIYNLHVNFYNQNGI